jgi:DNA-binding NtrC family response regulator
MKSTITFVLARTDGNVSEAARKLQMSRTFLLSLIKKHRIRE